MTKKPKRPKLPSTVPAAARKLFEAFPVAAGEDASNYASLVNSILDALEPQDTIEALLAKDVADHVWEIRRLRSIEAALFSGRDAATGIDSAMAPDPDLINWLRTPVEVQKQRPRTEKERADLERDFAINHPLKYAEHLQNQKDSEATPHPALAAFVAAQKDLASQPTLPAPSTDDRIWAMAEAFKKHSREIDQTSRLIAQAEVCRNAALREFERYRAARALARRNADDIIDAEYTEHPPGKPAGRR